MKGKKVTEYDTSKNLPSEACRSMLGPTGNLRAPTIRIRKTYLVGFNEEVLKKLSVREIARRGGFNLPSFLSREKKDRLAFTETILVNTLSSSLGLRVALAMIGI